MKKVIVIGSPGAGKTTFSRRLGEITGIPVRHLDSIWHLPDRSNIPREEFDQKLADMLKEESWIIDGNYSRTMEMRLQACDTVFLLDYPAEVCLAGVRERIGRKRDEMPWIEEKEDPEFMTFIREFPAKRLPQIRVFLEQYRQGRKINIFYTRAEAEQYLRKLTESGRNEMNNTNKLYQVSLLQSLMQGDYHGSAEIQTIKKYGDTGLGTFNRLDGELIMLEGTVYRAGADCTTEAVPDQETTPFASVTFFRPEQEQEITEAMDLREILQKKVQEYGRNIFHMIRIEGVFSAVHVRSVPPQTEPYLPLAEVMASQQRFYDYADVSGTVIGLYCPGYMSMLNAAGWHFHFIDDDRSHGGHVLDMTIRSGTIRWTHMHGFEMILPKGGVFDTFDLTLDQSEDIRKVETGESLKE